MNTVKVIVFSFGILIIFLISEASYVLSHPGMLSEYTLNAARKISAVNTDIAFYILTQGQLHLPQEQKYKIMISNYLAAISPKHDLPRVYYDLALISYSNGQEGLTPKLLELSTELDPMFSFWYVELANYYLSKGQIDLGKKALDNCINIDTPRQHCQDYLNNSFSNYQIENIGFLNESVNKFYELGKR